MGHVTGVVDQHINLVPPQAVELFNAARLAQIQGQGLYIHAVAGSQMRHGGVQEGTVARDQAKATAFCCKAFGRSPSNAPRGTGDQHAFVAQSEFHGLGSWVGTAVPCGRGPMGFI